MLSQFYRKMDKLTDQLNNQLKLQSNIIDKSQLLSFSYVDDDVNLQSNVEILEKYIMRNFDCKFGRTIFKIRKY